MKPQGLTVGLIIKNEEKLLGGCLKSIRKIADEIIVVDTGSTDRSISIARRFGIKLLHRRWDGNYSRMRNVYVDAAAFRWVLSIDGDERIAAKDAAKIRDLITQQHIGGFLLRCRVYSPSSHSFYHWHPNNGEYPKEEKFSRRHGYVKTQVLRLFRQGARYDESVGVHESMRNVLKKQNIAIDQTDATIHDFGWLKGGRCLLKKQKKYFEITRREHKQRKLSTHELRNLALGYHFLGRSPEKAIRVLREALREVPREADTNYLLALFYREGGEYEKAAAHTSIALQSQPRMAEALWLKGVCLDESGNAKQAEGYVKKALKLVPGHPLFLNSLKVINDGLISSSRRPSRRRRTYS